MASANFNSTDNQEKLDADRLRGYFLSILVKKDYSKKEFVDKGLLKGYDLKIIKAEMQFLKENNFVNDTRLAENIIDFYGKSRGRLWLKQKMQQRKVDSEVVEDVLTKFIEQEEKPDLSGLKKLVASKYRIQNWKNLEMPVKAKVLRFLAYRGFTNAYDILREWQN